MRLGGISNIRGRQRGLLLVALGLVVLVLLKYYSPVGDMFDKWRQTEEAVEAQESIYSRYLAILDRKADVEKVFAANKKLIEDIESKVFTGPDINVITTRLQKTLQDLANKHHLSIQRTNALKPEQVSDGLYTISLGVFGQAMNMADVNAFLREVEFYHEKFIYIPKLYLKNVRNKLIFELQAFSMAMVQG